MARVIAVVNQKGGVGKTTTVLNLGAALAGRNRRVLLLDLDPQECLTGALKVPSPEDGRSMHEVLTAGLDITQTLREVPGSTLFSSLTLVPAGPDLAEAEVRLIGEAGGQMVLREAIEGLARRYDYILIDCPPSLSVLTLNALVAAREVLIPVQCEYFALRRLPAMLRTVEKVRKRINRNLAVLGVLPTMFAHTLHSREALDFILKTMREQTVHVFAAIPRTVKLQDGAAGGMPILELARESDAASAYSALAKEIDA
jgi:chromosome partitioning protein